MQHACIYGQGVGRIELRRSVVYEQNLEFSLRQCLCFQPGQQPGDEMPVLIHRDDDADHGYRPGKAGGVADVTALDWSLESIACASFLCWPVASSRPCQARYRPEACGSPLAGHARSWLPARAAERKLIQPLTIPDFSMVGPRRSATNMSRSSRRLCRRPALWQTIIPVRKRVPPPARYARPGPNSRLSASAPDPLSTG